MLYTSHGIHRKQHPNFSEAITLTEKAVSYFEKAVTAARVKLDGRTYVEGPHVPSSLKRYFKFIIPQKKFLIEEDSGNA